MVRVRVTLDPIALGLQSRLADKETAESRAAALEADNHELAARLVETKRTEIQRMHETNRICEQMVRGAAISAARSRSGSCPGLHIGLGVGIRCCSLPRADRVLPLGWGQWLHTCSICAGLIVLLSIVAIPSTSPAMLYSRCTCIHWPASRAAVKHWRGQPGSQPGSQPACLPCMA